MTVIIKNETDAGEVFAGTISQIELGMLRAAYLGPDDVLVVQMPVNLSDEGWDRIRTELKLKIPDRRVVLVGPGVVFGVLNTEPAYTEPEGPPVDRAMLAMEWAYAQRLSRNAARCGQEIETWLEWLKQNLAALDEEIDRLRGLVRDAQGETNA